MPDFVSLHNHTSFSLMDSIINPNDLFSRAKELGQSAIAITDHGTLAGAYDGLKFSKKHGVKCIIGCEFNFVENIDDKKSKIRHVILLAKNQSGYKNLLLANKLANDNNIILSKRVMPRIDWSILERCHKDLICTTACGDGMIGRYFNTRADDQALNTALHLKDIFGPNLALEIQSHAMKRNSSSYNDYYDQQLVNTKIVKLGKKLDIKVIVTTNAHYLIKEDSDAHDAWLCVGSGIPIKSVNRLKYPTQELYVKSREEVVQFLSRAFDNAEEFCDNTLFFSNQCEVPEWINPIFTSPDGREFPEFPVKDQHDYNQFLNWLPEQSEKIKSLREDEQYLRYWCDKGLKERVAESDWPTYRERIDEELDVIEYRKFSSYIEIVADYVQFAKDQGISIGPGRGSAGGSLVCYLVGIHDADSIKHNLIFSRFINKFKEAFPDIDMDFSSAGRASVHAYIRRKYGEDHVAHVSNVITEKPKVYARDISRVFTFGGTHKSAVEIGNQIADSIPKDAKKVKNLIDEAPLFAEYAEKYPELKKFAHVFDGKYKAWGTHAGGLVISRRPLVEIVPLRRDKDGVLAVEYEKERVEQNGLLKMDILGVSTLDVIDHAFKIIESLNKPYSKKDSIQYESDDPKTYELITSGNTIGVFQFGTSPGTMDLCRRMKPKKITDLAIINALARPNAKDIRKAFIETRSSGKKVDLIHPTLENSLSPTYGYALYEDCLMFIAQDVAGWDLHEADNLRKLTKDKGKHPELIQKWRNNFISSAVEKKGLSKESAVKIWDEIIDKFQGYGFNKSHALFYSFLGFQTAYLKAHYPLEFLLSVLMHEIGSNTPDSEDNVRKIKNEIRSRGIKILPPNINTSEVGFKIIDENTVLMGLDSLKYVSMDAVSDIVSKRPFNSLNHLISSVSTKLVRANSIQALACCGALDCFGLTRKQIYLYIADYRKKLLLHIKRGKAIEEFNYPWPNDIGEWNVSERYAMEYHYMGECLSHTTREAYAGFFDSLALKAADIPILYPDTGDSHDKWQIEGKLVEGIIKNYFEFKVKNEQSKLFGETMAKVELEDPYGDTIIITLFPSGLEKINSRLKDLTRGKVSLEVGVAIHISGVINWYEGSPSVVFEDLRRIAPFPQKPKDLKSKSVSMRVQRQTKKTKVIDKQQLLLDLEERSIESGFICSD